MKSNANEISDWQALVNKPVYTSDGKEVGIVRTIQTEKMIVDYGPITPDHYLVPKSSVKNFDRGIVYLNKDAKFIEDNYRFE